MNLYESHGKKAIKSNINFLHISL